MRERRKPKKTPGKGATVKGKWPYYDIMNFQEYYLPHRNTSETFHKQQLHLIHSTIPKKLKSAILNWTTKVHVTTRM